MVRRIEVSLKPGFSDGIAKRLLIRLREDFDMAGLESLRRVNVYAFEEDLPPADAERLATAVFCDPVSQRYAAGAPVCSDFSAGIEVGFRPGVKDNVGDTARMACAEALGRDLQGGVYTSTLYLFSAEFAQEEAGRVAEGLLCNPLIEQWQLLEPAQIAQHYACVRIPKAGMASKGTVFEIPLPDDDVELEKISKRRLLALSLDEMHAIRRHYLLPDVRAEREKRGLSFHPTDVELEVLAQTWSEHCKHKIFNATIEYTDAHPDGGGKTGPKSTKSKSKKAAQPKKEIIHSLFKTYIAATTQAIRSAKPYLLSVFTDNAGVIALDENWALAVKVETHNTPSALDPYGGALTGILGVNRDVLGTGMGAKPIFNTDVFCFADPFYKGKIPPRLLHPRRVFEGVRAGVERGGNASGIPTVNGSIVFDDRYLGKPLVYCGTGGLMPRRIGQRQMHEKFAKPGDRIFMVGGRVGKDGIHGATFSSEGLHEGSPTSAVQLGDPFTQKLVLDFLIDSRNKGLHSALTDNGAGGLSSSVGEMAQMTGGALLHLDRCPLKYPGLDPWEIFISESQERMTVAVPPGQAGEFAALALQFGVEASDLGEFDQSGYLHVLYHHHTVVHLELKFLHAGLPPMRLAARWIPPVREEPDVPFPSDLPAALLALLARPNICSKESVVRQYDHEVQGMSVIKPMCGAQGSGPSDAAVLQPLPEKKMGIVVSSGICPRFGDIDPHSMARLAVDEAVRNYVATGGDPAHWGALDNFCWPDPVASPHNPDGEQKLAALVRANRGLAEACKAYALPLISGKDSMKNDYAHSGIQISVPPTLLVTLVGRISNVERAASTDFKRADDLIYVLGHTDKEMGGSEYYAMQGEIGTRAPNVNLEENAPLYHQLHAAISQGLVASAHDCSDGGLAVALAECCIGGRLGASVRLRDVPRTAGMRDDFVLFSESAGRFVVSVHPDRRAAFEKTMHGRARGMIGTVSRNGKLVIEGATPSVRLEATLEQMDGHFKNTITW